MTRFDGEGEWGDYPELERGRWKHNSRVVLTSKRGQRDLRAFIAALDAMPAKRLISGALIEKHYDDEDNVISTEVCAVGAYALYGPPKRDPADLYDVDNDWETAEVGQSCGLAFHLAWQMAYANDETFSHYTPEERWEKMREWAGNLLVVEP